MYFLCECTRGICTILYQWCSHVSLTLQCFVALEACEISIVVRCSMVFMMACNLFQWFSVDICIFLCECTRGICTILYQWCSHLSLTLQCFVALETCEISIVMRCSVVFMMACNLFQWFSVDMCISSVSVHVISARYCISGVPHSSMPHSSWNLWDIDSYAMFNGILDGLYFVSVALSRYMCISSVSAHVVYARYCISGVPHPPMLRCSWSLWDIDSYAMFDGIHDGL